MNAILVKQPLDGGFIQGFDLSIKQNPVCSLGQGEEKKGQRLVVVDNSSLPHEKPMPAKWKTNFSLVLKNHSLLFGKEIQQLVQPIFLLMGLPPAPQEIWLSKADIICSSKLLTSNYRGNSLVWQGSTFLCNKEKENIQAEHLLLTRLLHLMSILL